MPKYRASNLERVTIGKSSKMTEQLFPTQRFNKPPEANKKYEHRFLLAILGIKDHGINGKKETKFELIEQTSFVSVASIYS